MGRAQRDRARGIRPLATDANFPDGSRLHQQLIGQPSIKLNIGSPRRTRAFPPQSVIHES
jgi:hypothetical protein